MPALQLSNNILIDALSSGYAYDSASVASLVREGNRLFALRDLHKAADSFAAAYELARLHYVYPPLMHDLALRRALCFSMLGDLKRALFEVEIALEIVPNAPTTHLVSGIIYSKMRRIDEANRAFQRSAQQCPFLRDTVDCIVAMLLQARGHCDHAIEKCTEVLRRTPQFAPALWARGEAYRYHASGCFEKQAAADFADLLKQDVEMHSIAGDRFTLENHSAIEERLLRLHPWLNAEGPKPYEEYEMFHWPHAFHTAHLVCFAVAKMRVLVRSSHLVRSVRQKNEELLQQRAAAERRMQELVEAQRSFAQYEQHAEVWGPADPDNHIARKYRRYWMERPPNFPHRQESGDPQRQFSFDHVAAVRGFVGRSTQAPSPPVPPPPPPPLAVHSSSDKGRSPQAPMAPSEPVAPHSSNDIGVSQSPKTVVPRVSNDRDASKPHVYAPSLNSSGVGVSVPKVAPVPFLPTPNVATATFVDAPPPKRIGADWSDHQWFLKALELSDAFCRSSGGHGVLNLGTPPTCSPPTLPDYKPCRGDPPPPPPSRIVRGTDGKEENLIAVIEREGIDAVPDWFSTLDRIYTITDMALFSEKPDNFVGDSYLAGTPGYSYLVNKGSQKKSRAASQDKEEAKAKSEADEALLRRYQNRLIVTSLPSRT